ncbi:epoxide hydrolase [Streptomyces sp. NBC_00236]|uniref:epoxide hydrolase family protein n=1 Tax=unclassified Streptomyces TaxID=2593676 RepID=UPI002E2D1A1F|nr:epoxide hydrolase [Streptomyces sp. NBC_00236]
MTDHPPLIAVTDEELEDLRARLRATRWPTRWPVDGWEAGADTTEVRRLAEYWAAGYDWRAHEARINALPHHTAVIGGTPVHYLRFDGERPGALPIVLSHGWPSTFLELTDLARRLAEPSQHGGDASDAFTVVVPSLPGYGFSPQRPDLPPTLQTHQIWHRLMRDELGFDRYAAHGGDLGAGITSRLGEAYPESLAGIHLLAVAAPEEYDAAGLTLDEQAHLDQVANWSAEEGGYQHQQNTRPSPWPTRCPTLRPACWPGSWRSTAPGATRAATCRPGSPTTSSSPRPPCTGSPARSRRRSGPTTSTPAI